MECVTSAVILHAQLNKLSAVRDQLTGLRAKIDSKIGMHVRGLRSLKKLCGVILMAIRREPLAWTEKSILCTVGDEGTIQICTDISIEALRWYSKQCSPIRT